MSWGDRFWSKVDKGGSAENPHCWIWTAGKEVYGYGSFRKDGRTQKAHRVAYEALVEPIPRGTELDHLCRNRACVNPVHLEPVTHIENLRRGEGGLFWARKTHCPAGHPYDAANTRVYKGHRNCRECLRLASREYKRRARARAS